jgi:L-alanine-DL-glutamate epimerase-like enolase superfamily enzyme
MKSNRRDFLTFAAASGGMAIGGNALLQAAEMKGNAKPVTFAALEQVGAKPVLKTAAFKEPVVIQSIELLQKGKEYFIRVRSKDGAEGISVDNGRADVLAPIIQKLIAPYFIGKDARDLDELLFGVYREKDNYKFQGLALWCPVAMIEFAILDMLGRISKQPIYELIGTKLRDRIPFYVASGRRDTTPPQEIDYLKELIAKTGAKSVKYRLGGRMSRNEDAMPGRTKTLIPLTRKELGDKMAIHGDANSSYDPPQAIEVGKMMEDIGAVFYEEPCPFDNFEATKQVTDALKIPIALGEQESSHWRYQQQIANHVSDIVQPDLYYYGGLIRSTKVARMAELAGKPTTPHLSGGFGFVYSLHFCAATPEIGAWQEYKQGVETYGSWFDPPLKIVDGELIVPTGIGVGIADPKGLLSDAKAVKS